MFGILDWTTDILTMKTGIVSKELLPTGPHPPCPINHLSLLPLVGRLEEGDEEFKNEVGFKTPKPTSVL